VADLSKSEGLEGLIEYINNNHKDVDILVNNAGRSIRRSALATVDRMHDLERTMGINYFAPAKLTLGVLPHMVSRGGGVSVSSIFCILCQ
jgi:short-subunit dehydrogenase